MWLVFLAAVPFNLVTLGGRATGQIAWSPDGEWIVSADGTRWNTTTGRQLGAYAQSSVRVAVSPDGKAVALGVEDPFGIYDALGGNKIVASRNSPHHRPPEVRELLFVDNERLLRLRHVGVVGVYDVKTGKELGRSTYDGNAALVRRDSSSVLMAYTEDDGKSAAMYSLWLPSLSPKTRLYGLPHWGDLLSTDKAVKRVCISNDRETLTAGKHTTVVDAETGAVLWDRPGMYYATISPDGTRVIGINQPDRFQKPVHLELIEIPSGKTLVKREIEDETLWPVFSPDGKRVAVTTKNKGLLILGAETLTPMLEAPGNRVVSTDVAFSPDGKTVALAGGDASVVWLWDLETARLSGKLEVPKRPQDSISQARYVSFDKTGRFVGVVGWYQTLVFDVQTRQIVKKLDGKEARMSSDGKHAFVATSLVEHTVYDLDTGAMVADTKAGPLSESAWTPDGTTLVTVDKGGSVWAYDVAQKKESWRKRLYEAFPNELANWEPKYVTTNGAVTVAQFIDGLRLVHHTGSSLRLGERKNGHLVPLTGDVTAATVTHDGTHVVALDNRGMMAVWKLRATDAQLVHTFQAYPEGGTKVVASPFNPDWVAVSGRELRLVNIKTKQTVSFVAGGNDWAIYSDDGFFEASKDGGHLVSMVQGSETFAVDQFAVHNNRPDILLERLGTGQPEGIAFYKRQYERRLKKAKVEPQEGFAKLQVPRAKIIEAKAEGRTLTLKGECSDASTPVVGYSLFVNDVPLFTKPYTTAVEEKITLSAGANKVELSCHNQRGAESWRALKEVDGGKNEEPALYFLGFGVSQYKDAKLRLKYAAKDATDLGQVLAKMKGAFKKVYTKTYLDAQVTPKNIAAAKSFVAQAREDDVFVLFIAGHGMHDDSAEPVYYYLTHAADPTKLAQTAAPFEDIERLLEGIAPRRKLFLMDTCESGEVDDEAFATTTVASGQRARAVRGVRTKAAGKPPRPFLVERDRFILNDLSRRSGAIVFSSSRGGEFSYESDSVKNGFFTKQIKEALTTPAADADKDGAVSTDELRTFVIGSVPQMTNGMQHPTVDRDNLVTKFRFPIAK